MRHFAVPSRCTGLLFSPLDRFPMVLAVSTPVLTLNLAPCSCLPAAAPSDFKPAPPRVTGVLPELCGRQVDFEVLHFGASIGSQESSIGPLFGPEVFKEEAS